MENYYCKEELIMESIKEIEGFDFLDDQSKVDIILTLRKKKPSSKIELFFKPGYESYTKEDFKNNLDKIEGVFKNTSLPYDLEISKENDFHVAVFYVGQDNEHLNKIRKAFSEKDEAKRDLIIGKELGYPASATEGYRSKKIKKNDSLPEEVKNSEHINFLNFRLSEDHWEDELKTIKERADTLREISPSLYQKVVTASKK